MWKRPRWLVLLFIVIVWASFMLCAKVIAITSRSTLYVTSHAVVAYTSRLVGNLVAISDAPTQGPSPENKVMWDGPVTGIWEIADSKRMPWPDRASRRGIVSRG